MTLNELLQELTLARPNHFQLKNGTLTLLKPSRERVDLSKWQGAALFAAAVRDMAENEGYDFSLFSERASITRYHVDITFIDPLGERQTAGAGQHDDLPTATAWAAVRLTRS